MAAVKPVGMGWSRYRTLLGSRDFTAFWTAQSLSLLGDMFSFLALAWLVLQLTGSGAQLGAVLAVQGIPRVLLTLLGGAISDQLSARLTMLLSAAGRTLVAAVLAALVLTHAVVLWEVYVAAFLLGAISAFFMPALLSFLPQLVPSDLLESGNAAVQVSKQGSLILGPALAGVMVAAYGAGAAIAADAACFAATAGLLLVIRGGVAPAANRPGARELLRNVGEGVAYVWRSIPLRVLLTATTTLNLAFAGPATVGLTVLARQRLGGPAALGWALGGFGAGALVGAVATGSLPPLKRPGRLVAAICFLLGVGLALIGVLPNLPAVVVTTFLMGLGIGFANTFGTSWTMRFSERPMLGRVMALMMVAAVGLAPVSYALSGLLVQPQPALVFAAGGALLVVTGLICLSSRTFREL